MKEHLSCDWTILFKGKHTEEKWKVFLYKIQEAITLYVLTKETFWNTSTKMNQSGDRWEKTSTKSKSIEKVAGN